MIILHGNAFETSPEETMLFEGKRFFSQWMVFRPY